MEKDQVGTMMQSAKRVPISELNDCITCKLCKGYFVDATTIIECLHTFCRSCIVLYLEKNKYCPICDVQVHKTKPLLNIRYDKTIQDLVYKLVPRLYHNEVQNRRRYYENHSNEKPSAMEQSLMLHYDYILTPEEPINLTLKYYGCNEGIRYLRCPSAVSVSHLKKLLRIKYELTDRHKIEIFYDQDCLSSSLSLMDVAYIYSWKRICPLDLTYKIYECPLTKPKPEQSDISDNAVITNNLQHNNNNNNWKEVQLRISENGEMSITGIQDALVLDIPEKEIVINEGKLTEELDKTTKSNGGELEKEKPTQQVDVPAEVIQETKGKNIPDLKFIGKGSTEISVSIPDTTISLISIPKTSEATIVRTSADLVVKSSEQSTTKNASLNSVLNLTNNELSVIPLSTTKACTTTTVFSTTSKSMCCIKPAEKPTELKTIKRKATEDKGPPLKLPKPTILNHSIGLMNLSNNHPLKRHKLNRNGESVTEKPIVINKSVSGMTLPKPCEPKVITTPCYVPKPPLEKNGERTAKIETNVLPKISSSSHHVHPLHIPIITPSQLPHNQILNAHHSKTTTTSASQETNATSMVDSSHAQPAIKTKPSTPIGYKTLRDPPKSWNTQINLQIAKNSNAQNRQNSTDLKNVRPAKFFKGRNIPRYLGNPASGVKPMYQVHVSPEKDKNHSDNVKTEKREIKKHSIVKIDPKTLKPISEKAPETSNLSNVSVASTLQANQELRLNSTPNDLKINTSSVSIFNPLKLQSSPKGDRKSPKSPHSPKVKVTSCASGSAHSPSLSPKQQRDKTNLTFTPPNPFVPNLASPTLGPNQWHFANYNHHMLVAYQQMLYNHRMVAAGLVPSSMSHPLAMDMAMKSHVGSIPTKHPPTTKNDSKKTLETALEKLTQNKAKELLAAVNKPTPNKQEVKPPPDGKDKSTEKTVTSLNSNVERKETTATPQPQKKNPGEDISNAKASQNNDKPTINGDHSRKESTSADSTRPTQEKKLADGVNMKTNESKTLSEAVVMRCDKDLNKSVKCTGDGTSVEDRKVGFEKSSGT